MCDMNDMSLSIKEWKMLTQTSEHNSNMVDVPLKTEKKKKFNSKKNFLKQSILGSKSGTR